VKALTVLMGIFLGTLAFATPENWETYKRFYNLKPKTTAFKAECMNCHTQVPDHNAFGKDVKAMIQLARAKSLTPEVLAMIGPKDSDGDGWPNDLEIKQGFLPGDPKSHPVGMPPGQEDHSKIMPKNMDNEGKTLLDNYVPRHSFHPLIIHFPIALFLFGSALEVFGWRKGVPAIREAAWYCLLFGMLSTLIAIPTGLLAFYRIGFQWSGNPLIHFILAVSATLVMTGTVLWRRKAPHESFSYFALLMLAATLVGAAGHFGAQNVYEN